MLKTRPKCKKVEDILGEIACWMAVIMFVFIFISVIPAILDSAKLWENDLTNTIFKVTGPHLLLCLVIIVVFVFVAGIVCHFNPSREEIIDDQLLTILQRTEAMEKKICQHDQEISEMEEQLRAKTPSPLKNVSEEQQQAIIAKLKLVAKSPKGENVLNRAATAHFLRALQLCGVIDIMESPVDLRRWVENETKRIDPRAYSFTEAYTGSNKEDKRVQEMVQVIQSLLK